MTKLEIKRLLYEIENYLLSLPKDYSVCSHGKESHKEYRHGRQRKVWEINIKMVRPIGGRR